MKVSAPIHIIKGSDPVLVADRLSAVVDELVGERDRTETVDELSGDDYECAAIAMAAASVSMFGERVVVARNAGRFGADEVGPLLTYLADPNPTSVVVVAWEKPVAVNSKPLPKKLTDAVKAAGGVIHDSDPPVQAKQRSAWLDSRLADSPVALTPAAKQLIADRFGEDVGRVGGVLGVLEASFPAGTKLGPDDVEPFLGDAGSVPPWELTDAIDGGNVALAVERLQRMLRGDRHPLQVMATLQTHYERILRLDGAGCRSEADAAALLGMKGSTFPAKKALGAANRLGGKGVASAIRLLARADADLRGASAWQPELVMEVLVARLARLSGRR